MPKTKANPTPVNFEEWASSTNPRTTTLSRQFSDRCSTCTHPQLREAVRVVLKTWASGKGTPSMLALYEKTREQFGLPNSYSALREHIRFHEHELWSALRAPKETT